jgi:hypothetical protein
MPTAIPEVRHRLHRLLVEIGEEFGGDLREAHLGIPHRGGGVAVHRSEVSLSVDQGVAKGELLDHPHEGVVDRRVAVGVVLPDHVPHDAGRFLVRLSVLVAQFVHRVEDAALDRFEPVPHVGDRASHDHAHRVIQVTLAHLVLDGARHCLFGEEVHVRSACSCERYHQKKRVGMNQMLYFIMEQPGKVREKRGLEPTSADPWTFRTALAISRHNAQGKDCIPTLSIGSANAPAVP